MVAINFRRITDDGPKYWAEPGVKRPLFNVAALMRREPFICICEGELDTVAVTQAGLPAVGVPGANGWKDYFWRAFKGYTTVFMLADTDDEGAGMGLAKSIAEQIPELRITPMPNGHDANSFLLAYGRKALYDLIGVTQDAADQVP